MEKIKRLSAFASIILLFTVTVRIPTKGTISFRNVQDVVAKQYHYELTFSNLKIVYVPIMWTIVEEQ